MDDNRLLVIDGTQCRGVFRVYVGKEEKYIGGELFLWLFKIAVARVTTPTGLIAVSELDAGTGLGLRYMYRIRRETGLDIPSDRHGSVWLNHPPKRIFFNHRQLAALGVLDARISIVMSRHRELPEFAA